MVIFGILLIISCVILGFIILIQNPKGGGLSSSFGGIGNQIMGVKQTTDTLEKGTWIFASVVGVLCLCSSLFMSTKESSKFDGLNPIQKTQPKTPANNTPAQKP